MDSRYLKLAISCLAWLYTSLCRLSLRAIGKTPHARCVVLYYHSVPADERPAFARQMDVLKRHALPLNLEQEQNLLPGHRYAGVTFDDIFEDVIEHAVPELTARAIPAVLFITVETMGKSAAWWPSGFPERERRLASVEHLRSLPVGLFSIAAHTMTHPHLSRLPPDDARHELKESRRVLESALQRDVPEMSFPYGDFTPEVVQICKELGYKRVYTTEHKDASNVYSSFVVGRVKVDPSDWPIEFWLKLHGAYNWLPATIRWKRKIRTALGRTGGTGDDVYSSGHAGARQ